MQMRRDRGKLKVDIEFIGPLKEKAGVKYTSLAVYVRDGRIDAIGILRRVENRFRRKELKLIKEGRIMPGLLLFLKKPTGGIERLKLDTAFRAEDNLELVVAPMMDGG